VADLSNNLYVNKSSGYFSKARTEIAPLLPKGPTLALRVLEVGCSEGHTLEWLKKTGLCSWAAGVELYSELRASPGAIDQHFKLDIEKTPLNLPPASIDLILCLDVLEHLVNPWETLRSLDLLLKPGGLWIVSVPNIRNYRVLMDLAFNGNFEYTDSGVLDRTHLRFFTRKSAVDLIECSGSRHIQTICNDDSKWQKKLLRRLGLRDLIAKQFILSARKPLGTRTETRPDQTRPDQTRPEYQSRQVTS
jgi:2-polyprenyl-3-methyl-5-hydroxy-6-metoxy-1,4-benzoquinol methylase